MNKINTPIKFILLIVALVCIALAYNFIYENTIEKTQTSQPIAKLHNGEVVQLRLAITPEEQRKGLSKIEGIPQNEGMLFILEEESVPNFWMKDTLFPLDILWIKDNKIVDISENLQPQGETPTGELPLYSPDTKVDMVLEVNAGFVKNKQLLDTKVRFSGID